MTKRWIDIVYQTSGRPMYSGMKHCKRKTAEKIVRNFLNFVIELSGKTFSFKRKNLFLWGKVETYYSRLIHVSIFTISVRYMPHLKDYLTLTWDDSNLFVFHFMSVYYMMYVVCTQKRRPIWAIRMDKGNNIIHKFKGCKPLQVSTYEQFTSQHNLACMGERTLKIYHSSHVSVL